MSKHKAKNEIDMVLFVSTVLVIVVQQEDEEGINPLIKVWNFDKVHFVVVFENYCSL